jgi:hypothetical protein
MPHSTLFDRCNHTELYQLCNRVGIPVRPNEARETMIALLEGEQEPVPLDEADHPIHTWRHGLINFARDYWKQIESQVDCPVRKIFDKDNPDPRPCFGCTDTQVIACVIGNSTNESLVEARRLVKKKESR